MTGLATLAAAIRGRLGLYKPPKRMERLAICGRCYRHLAQQATGRWRCNMCGREYVNFIRNAPAYETYLRTVEAAEREIDRHLAAIHAWEAVGTVVPQAVADDIVWAERERLMQPCRESAWLTFLASNY